MGHAPPQRVNALVRAVRFTPGVPYLATGSEPAQPRRAAALCSDFRACKRDPPPSPSHLLCVCGRDHRAYGAVRHVHSFFPYNVTDARNTACPCGRESNCALNLPITVTVYTACYKLTDVPSLHTCNVLPYGFVKNGGNRRVTY